MGLVKCFYCSAAVSGSARECPECKNVLPAGVPCLFCGVCLRKEEALRFRGGPVDTQPPLFEGAAHPSCVDTFWALSSDLLCRDCLTPLFLTLRPCDALGLPHVPCAKCGCATPLGYHLPRCYYCGRAILPTQQQGPPMRVYGDYDGPTQYECCHSFCDRAQSRINEFNKIWFGL